MKLFIDNSGRIKVESKPFIEGKLTLIHPGGRMARDEKGRIVDTRTSSITLYDGKYHWLYESYKNTFSKEAKAPDFSQVRKEFYLGRFASQGKPCENPHLILRKRR